MKEKERVSARIEASTPASRTLLAWMALAAALTALPGAVSAQSEGVWTFSTDSANNLVIQDLAAFSSAEGTVAGAALCLRFHPVCPSGSERRAGQLRLARTRYTVRGSAGREGEWRIEVGQPSVRPGGVTLPLQVGVQGQALVQVVSSPGVWSVDLQRIPAYELNVGDGKRWNVFLTLAETPAEGGNGCWVELSCPAAN